MECFSYKSKCGMIHIDHEAFIRRDDLIYGLMALGYLRSGKSQCKKTSLSSYFNKIKTHDIFYYDNFTFE